MDRYANAVKRDASTMDAMRGGIRYATVQSYDPTNAAVKVMIQPDGVLSGWVPLPAIGVGANAVIAGPNVGDQVIIGAMEGAGEQYVVLARVFDSVGMPPTSPGTMKPVESGEVGIFGPNGSYLHMAGGQIYASCTTFALTGTLAVTGKITATQDVVAGTISLEQHLHPDVQAGTAKTGAPVSA